MWPGPKDLEEEVMQELVEVPVEVGLRGQVPRAEVAGNY